MTTDPPRASPGGSWTECENSGVCDFAQNLLPAAPSLEITFSTHRTPTMAAPAGFGGGGGGGGGGGSGGGAGAASGGGGGGGGAAGGAPGRAPEHPLGRKLPVGKTVPATTFCSLFGEMINYYRTKKGGSIAELEARLHEAGAGIGYRLLELLSLRTGKRELDVLHAVQFVSGPVWTHLFGRRADKLDVSKDGGVTEYRIWDNLPLTNTYISLPRELARFNPACFIAGIVRGVLDGAGFPCAVRTMSADAAEFAVDTTVYVIAFAASVWAREAP